MPERIYPEAEFLPRPKKEIAFGGNYTNERVLAGIRTSTQQALQALGIQEVEGLPNAAPVPKVKSKKPKSDETVAGTQRTTLEGDFGISLHTLAKQANRNPQELAQSAGDIISNLADLDRHLISGVTTDRGYVNIELDTPRYAQAVLTEIERYQDSYGSENIGKGKKVVIDMSSPNVAKPMHFGHLRSTVIGESLSKILEFTGHKVLKDNHIGDWGAQFGLVLKAIELWGHEYPELTMPGKEVDGLLKLYQRINSESELEKATSIQHAEDLYKQNGELEEPEIIERVAQLLQEGASTSDATAQAVKEFNPLSSLEIAGREWFRRLEQGDPEAITQWQRITQLSMKEFEEVYKLLGVKFDLVLGEGFYGPMLPDTVKKIASHTDFVKNHNGAIIAHLEDEKLGKLVVLTGDGRTVYATRDVAGAEFRQDVLGADAQIYVVGGEQRYYFKQVFAVLKRMGLPIAENSTHIPFGMVKTAEGKFSTRKGNIIRLKDVLDQMIAKAYEISTGIEDEEKRREVARQVGVGALIWADLSQGMDREIIFDWEKVLSIAENTGPYVQYTHARSSSINRVAKKHGLSVDTESEAQIEHLEEKQVVMLLGEFPSIVKTASEKLEPQVVAQYLTELSRRFNEMYNARDEVTGELKIRFIENIEIDSQEAPKASSTRLRIATAVSQVLKNGLDLLGIEAPDVM